MSVRTGWLAAWWISCLAFNPPDLLAVLPEAGDPPALVHVVPLTAQQRTALTREQAEIRRVLGNTNPGGTTDERLEQFIARQKAALDTAGRSEFAPFHAADLLSFAVQTKTRPAAREYAFKTLQPILVRYALPSGDADKLADMLLQAQADWVRKKARTADEAAEQKMVMAALLGGLQAVRAQPALPGQRVATIDKMLAIHRADQSAAITRQIGEVAKEIAELKKDGRWIWLAGCPQRFKQCLAEGHDGVQPEHLSQVLAAMTALYDKVVGPDGRLKVSWEDEGKYRYDFQYWTTELIRANEPAFKTQAPASLKQLAERILRLDPKNKAALKWTADLDAQAAP